MTNIELYLELEKGKKEWMNIQIAESPGYTGIAEWMEIRITGNKRYSGEKSMLEGKSRTEQAISRNTGAGISKCSPYSRPA